MCATVCVGVAKYSGIRRAEHVVKWRNGSVDRVKISDGNRQLEMGRGRAGKGTEMNRTVHWMRWCGLD